MINDESQACQKSVGSGFFDLQELYRNREVYLLCTFSISTLSDNRCILERHSD
ncbi:hypothetical protein BH09BAC3_BH09BAC3_19100 [soil metagenome]